MKSSRLGREIGVVLARLGLTQVAYSASCDLANTTVSKLRVQGMRPGPGTLRSICQARSIDRADGVDLLCCHLRDEIEHAGFPQEDVNVAPGRRRSAAPADVDWALDVLREAAVRPDVLHVVCDLALVCRALVAAEAPLLAAEGRSPWGGKKKPGQPPG